MKIKSFIYIILMGILLAGCIEDEDREIRALNIGDKFTYQEYPKVNIARANKNVVVYRHSLAFSNPKYYYFSTTRKDSIIYDIRSVIKHN